MKPGDLVRCDWQPGGTYNHKTNSIDKMKYKIKGELGILVEQRLHRHSPSARSWRVLFPRFNYTHHLSVSAFKLVSCA